MRRSLWLPLTLLSLLDAVAFYVFMFILGSGYGMGAQANAIRLALAVFPTLAVLCPVVAWLGFAPFGTQNRRLLLAAVPAVLVVALSLFLETAVALMRLFSR